MKILSPAIAFLFLFTPFSGPQNLKCTRVIDGNTIILINEFRQYEKEGGAAKRGLWAR